MVMLQDHLWPEGERNRIYSLKKPSNEGFFFIFTDCLNVLNSKGILHYKQLLNIMTKINNKIFSIFTSIVLISPLSILDADDQLFGGSKEKDSGSSNQAAKQMVQEAVSYTHLTLPTNREV